MNATGMKPVCLLILLIASCLLTVWSDRERRVAHKNGDGIIISVLTELCFLSSSIILIRYLFESFFEF